jgi:Phosphotransferase enzyme family
MPLHDTITAASLAVETMPLPTPGWGAAQALHALDQARDELDVRGLRLPDATVVSALTTVVLRAGEYAVKVYPPGTDAAALEQIQVALTGSSTTHLPVGAPVSTAAGVLTVIPWLRAAAPVTWAELGALLRAFHTEHQVAAVPRWVPLSRLASQVRGLPEEAARVLLDARVALLAALDEVDSEVGEGIIHGDVSPSNVMRATTGPRLIDVDWVSRGPREYDLASAARRVADGEISVREYDAFCAAYGFDVRGWAGLPVLNRIADLSGVAFRLWDSRQHGRSLDWIDEELRVWRTAP